MSKVKIWLSRSGGSIIPPEVLAIHNASKDQLDELAERIESMRQSFTEGGSITFDELASYIVSTPETPMRYETGEGCFIYRMPCDDPDQLVFYCEFEPKPGKPAAYGWHNHPDCIEETIQIKGKGYVNGVVVERFATMRFQPGQFHDYKMKAPGSIFVTFTRVKQ